MCKIQSNFSISSLIFFKEFFTNFLNMHDSDRLSFVSIACRQNYIVYGQILSNKVLNR